MVSGEAKKTYQQVVGTHLVVVVGCMGMENLPTSCGDSLVVVVGGVGGEAKKTYQRVVGTRW
jgi:hypothetical protein